MSSISTHVLDTALGKPASGVPIHLQKENGKEWDSITKGVTNADGRIPEFISKDKVLVSGTYRMTFETKTYFEKQKVSVFYPVVHVIFEIKEGQHYHIPLLLSPFGYSTYRGS